MRPANVIPMKLVKLQSIFAICIFFSAYFPLSTQAESEVLQGSVEENDALTRLARPNLNSGVGKSDSLRLGRPGNASPLKGLVDTSKFSGPLKGNLKSDTGSLGLVQPDEFKNLSADKFDLGADRGSKELTIAWELWYKQLSGAIYRRWSQVADIPGHAIVRVTVTRERSLSAVMVKSSGNREFDSGLLRAILSLDGNPGLNFPSQSERKVVALESDYIAGTDIEPGYSWIKNDYERVSESY